MKDFITTALDRRGVATITLNRPDVHNAFNADVIAALHAAFLKFGGDDDVRVVVVRAEGRSFSAGADLAWMKAAARWTARENQEDAERLSGMLDAFNSCPKPTIAMVQGAAFGGGVGLVACADVALACERATFALTEVRLGILPATISPYVVAAMGERACRRLFLTGERFSAQDAKTYGLVHEVIEDEAALQARTVALIEEILKGAPHAQAASKQLIFDVTGREIDANLRQETARRIARHRTGEEGQEGLAAFFEKRPPYWTPGDK